MSVSEIQLYEILVSKLGKEEARSLVEFVENKAEKKVNERTEVFATKQDIGRLEAKIAESKVDIIKWMVGMAITIVGLVVAAIKLM